MEYWEILDSNGNSTGKIMERYDKKVFESGFYHYKLKFITKFKTGNVWIDTYILKCDYEISKMKFQKDEVSDAKWATWEEINDLVDKELFIKNRWEFVNKLLKEEILS